MKNLKNHYYFKEEFIKKGHKYLMQLSIYQLDNDLNPCLLTRIEYNYAEYSGGHNSTFKYLMDKGLIIESHYDKEYWGEKQIYKIIKIHELF